MFQKNNKVLKFEGNLIKTINYYLDIITTIPISIIIIQFSVRRI